MLFMPSTALANSASHSFTVTPFFGPNSEMTMSFGFLLTGVTMGCWVTGGGTGGALGVAYSGGGSCTAVGAGGDALDDARDILDSGRVLSCHGGRVLSCHGSSACSGASLLGVGIANNSHRAGDSRLSRWAPKSRSGLVLQ